MLFVYPYSKENFSLVKNLCSLAPTDKPQIEELQQFLEFQLPRHWAPVFSDLPLGPQRKKHSKTFLRFSLMGPKLFINTSLVQ